MESKRDRAPPGSCSRIPRSTTRCSATLTDIHKVVTDLNEGKGTAGKLLNSDELHQQFSGSIAKIDSMIDKINSGQGTIGQLMVNPQLYDNLNGATRELHGLHARFPRQPEEVPAHQARHLLAPY